MTTPTPHEQIFLDNVRRFLLDHGYTGEIATAEAAQPVAVEVAAEEVLVMS